MKIFLIILILIFAPDAKPDELLISSKINAVLPEGMSVQNVKESQIENLYIVDIGDLQPIYASKNGEFFFYGELYAVNGNMLQNTTKDEINLKRKNILDEALSEDDFITFKSNNEKHRVIIFTDVDCGYCRKFHNEINDFNDLGITVNYVAFPRSGLASDSYNKIVTAWCSTDAKDTLTKMKQGIDVQLSMCQDHPVEKHFLLGQKIGITGTPAIIKSNGELLPGYLPPEELITRLN
ncbi:MAG: thioredoxin fold domain-containing protein [SAR86 cluster bacterium]|nr:thioredoxin fold domain-containing protein [SAR86 cluster bacterium]MDA8781057.1 thioredoxin fold domain-containing protein [Gammaproteobacteria bacterium]MBL6822262.1 thioredoxin fold domain-containing protein [SAR86 cluster bacterium]MDB2370453.1 thioredoxin fold domain-containing protein [Gammaproteobacteria bacterium]MDB2411074.1 thioredoxin fold domain-containing protein [Gammaproteobacteria bacterium]